MGQSIIIALPRKISIPITSTLTMADTEQKVAEEVTANQVEDVAEEPKVTEVAATAGEAAAAAPDAAAADESEEGPAEGEAESEAAHAEEEATEAPAEAEPSE